MKKIKRALISVSNKNNLKFLLKNLKKFNINFISSGGTYKEIKKWVLNVKKYQNIQIVLKFYQEELKHYTQKYMLVYYQIENLKSHKNDLKKNNYNEIDLVIVNFYPFEKTI